MISFTIRSMLDEYNVEAVVAMAYTKNTDGNNAEHATIILIGKSNSGKSARKAALWCVWESSVSRSLQVISKLGSVVFYSSFYQMCVPFSFMIKRFHRIVNFSSSGLQPYQKVCASVVASV